MPRTLTGSWPVLASWGAGLVQLALGAGMVTGPDIAARAVGLALVSVGVLGIAWGIAVLRGPSTPTATLLARWGIVVAVVGLISTPVALVIDPVRTGALPVAVAVALWLVAGVGAARMLRGARSAAAAAASRRRGAGIQVLGVALGTLAIAGLVTPALAATEAGQLAPHHSSHQLVFDEHQH